MAVTKALLGLLFLYGVSAQNGCTAPANLGGPTGIVASANPYGDNAKCRWTVTVEAGKAIELNFGARFDVEQSSGCQYDKVVIYDSDAVAQVSRNAVCSAASLSVAAKHGPFCGFDNPGQMVSSGNRVIVEFCSDSSANGAGFEIAYKEVGAPPPPPSGTTCSETVEVDGSHTVTYWNNVELPNFLNCAYTYTSKNGKKLKVNADRFSLEGIIGCRYDSLKVYDGAAASGQALLGTFCGTNGPKNVRGAQSNSLHMVLTSDQYTNGKGISLTIEETCEGDHLCSSKDASGNDVCYSDSQVCDRTSQCPDGQDESYCAEDCGAFPNWEAGQPLPGAAAITHIDGQIHCGGALINKQYVLTTAHCFHRLDDKPERFNVKLGAARLSDAYQAQIESITVHPDFNPRTLANNLAMVKLRVPAPVQSNIAPFCFPAGANAAPLPEGTVCRTLGWGRTNPTGITSYAASVKHLSATIQTNSKCRWASSPVVVDNNSICASTSGALCFGDNGAPLVCRAANGKWQVSGINSVAFGCTGGASIPSAFVKVAAYSDWIVNTAFAKKV